MSGDEASRPAAAHAARTLLAPALADLEGLPAPPSYATRALEHAAHALSSLYAADAEATTEAAVHASLRKALDALSHALDALHEAPERRGAIDQATSAVAHTLAFLYPVVTATQRRRREVVPPVAAERTSEFPPREQRRTGERTLVEVDIGLLSDSNFYTGYSGDISGGGVFVATPSPLPPGSMVTLYFVLPDGRPVRAAGSVRWARGAVEGRAPGMGVGFTALDDDDRAAVANYCATRLPLFHE